MSEREWKPGDVAMVNDTTRPDAPWKVAMCTASARPGVCETRWRIDTGEVWGSVSQVRPLAVIDPEDREQVERLIRLQDKHFNDGTRGEVHADDVRDMQAALREFAKLTPPEPTDPRAYVTDRRENVWRLLADGDWVCTSGPDIGEYIVWSRLVAERGPVEVEGVQ